MSSSSNFLTAALEYIGRGSHVIPLYAVDADGRCSCGSPQCGTPGKHPRTTHGLKDGTTNPATVRSWWTSHPSANLGIVTGPPSGCWVLGPDGPEGLADLDRLAEVHGPLPETLRARSGSGGEHWYFRWPTDGQSVPNRRNHRGTRIDVRGAGGYVVAPPSANANGCYAWINDCELAEAPGWLVEWVRGVTLKVPIPKPRPSVLERARLYLGKCEPAVSGQNGHARTFAAARALAWGFALPEAEALAMLTAEYNPRCSPPWSEAELRHKIHDAAEKDFGKPRGYLLEDDSFKSTSNFRDFSPDYSS